MKKRAPESHADALTRFRYWYSNHGHWVYASRERAFEVWTTRGIENQAPPPAGLVLA